MKRFATHLLVAALVLPLAATAYAAGHERNSKAPNSAVQPAASVTHGSIKINGQTIRYTATVDTIVLKNDKGGPTASMFYIAYTKDGEPADKRPVTFAWNGGPGGPRCW